QDVRAMAGVPSWILMIVKRVLELEQKDNLCEVWSNLELFMHGGVNFAPYKKQYQHITNENLCFWQVYNASEGYFATQDRLVADDMLLLVDNGVFFEFIPLQDFVSKDYAKAVPLEQVKLDRNYVIVISTNAGLWRYVIGDVVRFTSLNPYRIIITGRTTNFVNAFGEELIVDNAEKAIAFACKKTNAIVNEYTMAPVYPSSTQQAAHQWLIEFEQAPQSLSQFVQLLDEELKNQNSDYEAKRTADILLQNPIVQQIPYGTFLKWLASKNKLGGQFKVPRLSNDRHVIEEILSMVNK
ncbi:MAG: GH3 auxin-responsive promoter family protein, partial [Bacteroidales bacterium]|nr:GH3 auxin-responsive promoter family protein [Bacteroidales bacterium]